jgi:hypothetical protein
VPNKAESGSKPQLWLLLLLLLLLLMHPPVHVEDHKLPARGGRNDVAVCG